MLLNNKNQDYKLAFQKNKYALSDITGASKQEIDTYIFNMNTNVSYQHFKEPLCHFNNISIQKLNISEKTFGACGMLSSINLEAFAILLEENFSFLTIGKILHQNKNIFSVPEREIVISKMKQDQQQVSFSLLGSNIHAWITLGNGLIIDPSISMSLYSKNDVIIGFPNELANQYIYEPYIVADFKDISEINKMYKNMKNIVINKIISEKLDQMLISKKSIKDYY